MSSFERIPMADLESATLPIEEASGLPNAVYNDPAFLTEERERVMSKTWSGTVSYTHLTLPTIA